MLLCGAMSDKKEFAAVAEKLATVVIQHHDDAIKRFVALERRYGQGDYETARDPSSNRRSSRHHDVWSRTGRDVLPARARRQAGEPVGGGLCGVHEVRVEAVARARAGEACGGVGRYSVAGAGAGEACDGVARNLILNRATSNVNYLGSRPGQDQR